MSDIEKGSVAHRGTAHNGEHLNRGPEGNHATALAPPTFLHNTGPNLRVLGNPGPLSVFIVVVLVEIALILL